MISPGSGGANEIKKSTLLSNKPFRTTQTPPIVSPIQYTSLTPKTPQQSINFMRYHPSPVSDKNSPMTLSDQLSLRGRTGMITVYIIHCVYYP